MRVVVPTLPVAPAGAWRQGPASRGGVPPAKAAEQYVPPWVANHLLSVARAAGALVARCVCSWGNQPPTLWLELQPTPAGAAAPTLWPDTVPTLGMVK